VLCAEVTSQDTEAEQKVVDDVVRCGLVQPREILDTMLQREGYGYAVYDLAYAERLASVREVLARFGNLHLLGRSASSSIWKWIDLMPTLALTIGWRRPSTP
jgi:protoporphyrinogen oxidase